MDEIKIYNIFFNDKTFENKEIYSKIFSKDIESYYYIYDELLSDESYIQCKIKTKIFGYDIFNDFVQHFNGILTDSELNFFEKNLFSQKSNFPPDIFEKYCRTIYEFANNIYQNQYFYLIHDVEFDDYHSEIDIFFMNQDCRLVTTHSISRNTETPEKDLAYIYSEDKRTIIHRIPFSVMQVLNYNNHPFEIMKFYYKDVVKDKIEKAIKLAKVASKLDIKLSISDKKI